jgi:lipopolysaccharide transport system ATP-binding protein
MSSESRTTDAANTPPGDTVIDVAELGKCFRLHTHPSGRLMDVLSRGRLGGGTDFWALKGVSFSVRRGSTVGIIGANGSGKSTLLQVIAKTLQATEGKLLVKGRVAALLELGAGFNPELTGRENLRMSAALYGLTGAALDAVAPAIEAFAEIGDFLDQPVKRYSSGMFVRLAFAVIAHVKADVLIVDEALSVGDAYFAQKCMRFLHAFRQTGSVLFVSHDMSSVKSLCDHVVWLEAGVVVAQGDPKDIADAYLERLYAREQRVDGVVGVGSSTMPKPQQTISRPHTDVRAAAIQTLGLVNVIKVFQFNNDKQFGAGAALIDSVRVLGSDGEPVSSLEGMGRVRIEIRAVASRDLVAPIIGFFLRNRLGLNVLGDNTYLVHREQPIRLAAGQAICGVFEFVMPALPKGAYSLCVAIATGTNQEHEQQHWINDAVMLESVANHVHADVFGLPMLAIGLEPCANDAQQRQAS